MRRIPDTPLDQQDQDILNDLQKKVNEEPDFVNEVNVAKRLWSSKGGAEGKKAFRRIQKTLRSMCVHTGICNYCEHSEATDIEHISPKSYYPRQAFVWTNYLLACKTCNTHYKSDKWFVLDDQDQALPLVRGMAPPYPHSAFIQPRLEDPQHYLLLNTQSFTFEILPGLPSADQARAEKTLEILQLNHRGTLIEARRKFAGYFLARMLLLEKVVQAASVEDIEDLYGPYDPKPPGNVTLDTLKAHCVENVRKDIISSPHPSVWYAIRKVDSQVTPRWQRLFQVLPQALSWE